MKDSKGHEHAFSTTMKLEAGQTQENQTCFEHVLPENSLEYFIFIIDDNLQVREQIVELEALRKAALHDCHLLTKDYIWQRDEFVLESKRENGLVYLHGLTRYGDAVDDEWLIVYLLRQLSRNSPNLWVRVFDDDGEFLLMEAASVLPSWLRPELDHNRVWINQEKLYIVPKAANDLYQSPSITLHNALDFIKVNRKDLFYSDSIETEAFHRLKNFPAQIHHSLHHSKVTIPRKLCCLLHELPKSIAPAIEAFYLRDSFSLKSIDSPIEQLTFPPTDLVTVSVRFSRILFAQLTSQRFEPPQTWSLDTVKQASLKSSDDTERNMRLNTGMKLTCGFEMLTRQTAKGDSRTMREFELCLQDLAEDGDSRLPTNSEIALWPDVDRDDSEDWMNIGYEDLERELQGKSSTKNRSNFEEGKTQTNLQTIISRFEAFLKDDSAGIDGAEVDEVDLNEDSDSDHENEDELEWESGGEDDEIHLDENEFSRLVLEMMGTADPSAEAKAPILTPSSSLSKKTAGEENDRAIHELTSQFEDELAMYGAQSLERSSEFQSQPESDVSLGTKQATQIDDRSDDVKADATIQYNLAKNLLESFKSQAGMPGPTGNLLSLMGIQLPRDEDEDEDGGWLRHHE